MIAEIVGIVVAFSIGVGVGFIVLRRKWIDFFNEWELFEGFVERHIKPLKRDDDLDVDDDGGEVEEEEE